ncbi:hypothetical protein EAI28_22440 [Faecalicatena contorta]|nr:hypothetical protein [Faecalicatena contorta]
MILLFIFPQAVNRADVQVWPSGCRYRGSLSSVRYVFLIEIDSLNMWQKIVFRHYSTIKGKIRNPGIHIF